MSGDVARYTDYPAHQNGKLPLVLGALLLVTFLMTLYAFRSVVLALIGVVLNLLSAAAALEESSGFGLDGMRKRLAELGGRLTVTSSVGDGTRILALIPPGGEGTHERGNGMSGATA